MLRPLQRESGRIKLPMLIVLVVIGLGLAYWYLNLGGKKATDKTLEQVGTQLEKAADQAGKDVQKSAADTAADLDRRNDNIQKKRGFDVTK